MCPSATEETYSSFRSLDQPEEQKHCVLIQAHWQCDFGFRDRAGHKNIRGQRNPPGRPCTQSHRDYSPILLSSPISASILLQRFPVPSSGSPFLTHTLCPQPLPTPAPIVSPLHLLSAPVVTLLAASHWDHMAAEVWRPSQWSVTPKDVHIHPSPGFPPFLAVNNSLSGLFQSLPDH